MHTSQHKLAQRQDLRGTLILNTATATLTTKIPKYPIFKNFQT